MVDGTGHYNVELKGSKNLIMPTIQFGYHVILDIKW